MRSEFEKLFKAQRSYRNSDKEAFIRGCEAAYQHRQTEVDELQKRVDAALKMLDQFYCEGNLDSLEKAEQALKGG